MNDAMNDINYEYTIIQMMMDNMQIVNNDIQSMAIIPYTYNNSDTLLDGYETDEMTEMEIQYRLCGMKF